MKNFLRIYTCKKDIPAVRCDKSVDGSPASQTNEEEPRFPSLSPSKTLLLGVAVIFAALCLGFNYHCVTVTLNQLAKSLDIAEGDLQWASNAYMLAMASQCIISGSLDTEALYSWRQGCTSLLAGRAADILGMAGASVHYGQD
jgi:hypothetical protein